MKKNLLVLLAGVVSLYSAPGYKVLTRYPIGGTEGWDYLMLDEVSRRLYISHGTQVEVLNADTGKSDGVIGDTPGVHGIALAPRLHRGFTSNGRENKVTMFDSMTLKPIKKIDVGKGPDGIYFHPGSNRVFTNNHGSHDITAIDAAKGEVAGTVKLEGDGEQAIFGKDGLIYVNSEDTAEVVSFDPKTLEVKKRYPIGVAKVPTGLAYDAKSNMLFIGMRDKPMMAVMDAGTGKVVASFPIGAGVDWAEFDPASKTVYFSCGGGGVINEFHQKSATEYEDAGAIKTQVSAKTMAFDTKTKKIFLPAAEYIETPNADPSKRPTRKVKPDTFGVLVVGK